MRPILLLAASLLLASLTAPAPARDRNAIPAAVPAGPPRRCIALNAIRQSRVRTCGIGAFQPVTLARTR